MAVYLLIDKVAEDETHATYSFGARGGKRGELRIRKEDGFVELVRSLEGEHGHKHFMRAYARVFKHWQKGELPNETDWAS